MKRRHLWIVGVLGVLSLLLLATGASCQGTTINAVTCTVYDGNVRVGYLSCRIEKSTSLTWVSVGIPHVKIPVFVTDAKVLGGSTVITITNDDYKGDQGPGSQDELFAGSRSDFIVDPDDLDDGLTTMINRYYGYSHPKVEAGVLVLTPDTRLSVKEMQVEVQ